MGELERKLRPIRQKVAEVEKAAQQVERATRVERPRTPTVEVRGPSLRGMLLSHAQQLLAGGVVMFFLLYFLLATGDGLRARLASLAASDEGRANVLEIAHRVERAISSYLATVTLINGALGLLTGALMYALGMPNPMLWGALAALLNFIPYLGAMTTTVVLAVVALLTFDTVGRALLVPAAFLLLTSLEGQLVTPMLLGRRLSLNPVVIFLGLIFWAWLWGWRARCSPCRSSSRSRSPATTCACSNRSGTSSADSGPAVAGRRHPNSQPFNRIRPSRPRAVGRDRQSRVAVRIACDASR